MLDEKTQILTKTGWKDSQDISKSDIVLQWNHASGMLSWTNPTNVVKKHYKGPVVIVANTRTDQVMTPTHKIFAKFRLKEMYLEAFEYKRQFAAKHFQYFSCKFPLAGILPGTIDINPDLAYIIGWWLTDAYIGSAKNTCVFTQCKPKMVKVLQKALAPYKPKIYIAKPKKVGYYPEHTFHIKGALAEYLLANYPDREMNWEMIDWKRESKIALVQGMMDGDGTDDSNRKVYKLSAMVFWSKKPHRRELFSAITTTLGYRSYENLNKYAVYFNKDKNYTTISKKHHRLCVMYDGLVCGIDVPHKAFVAKRNTKIFISGSG